MVTNTGVHKSGKHFWHDRIRYVLASALLFVIEVLIALFMRESL